MASSYRADSRAHGAAALQGQTGFFPSARCSLVGSHTHCSRNQCEGGPVGGPGLVFTSGSAQSPRRQGAWVLGSHRLRRGFQEQRQALGQPTASRVTFRHRSLPGRRPGVTAKHPAGTWSPGASCTDNNQGAAKKAMP